MNAPPRVALFADSFQEVNGVALTCRMFAGFAQHRGLPLLVVHTGQPPGVTADGLFSVCRLPVSPLALRLEHDLRFDLLFLRQRALVAAALRQFQPDIIHITGPSHIGILGALAAAELRLPLTASWHTNLHQYAARRLDAWAPGWLGRLAERASLRLCLRFYALARQLFAPNEELRQMLASRTGRPCRLMRRGVDSARFTPARRERSDQTIVVGYVGRLSPEKSVRRLLDVELALQRAGVLDYRIEMVGHGDERGWLHRHLSQLKDHGVLNGDALADAYAGFDIFAFPSETDTYGNVVQESMASGVPCVVMASGGPAQIVNHGRDGLVAACPAAFQKSVVTLARQPALRLAMGRAARHAMLDASWRSVFESVYEAYAELRGPSRPAIGLAAGLAL